MSSEIQYKTCSHPECQKILPITDFDKRGKGRVRFCKPCMKKYRSKNRKEYDRRYRENNKDKVKQSSDQYRKSLKGFITQILHACKVYDTNRGFDTNELITREEIQKMIISQKGLCKLTGIPFIAEIKNDILQMSIDRIDSSKGHTYNNSQLILLPMNYLKRDYTNEFVSRMINFFKTVRIKVEKCEIFQLNNNKRLIAKIKDAIRCARGRSKMKKLKDKNFTLSFDDIDFIRAKSSDCCSLTGVPLTYLPNCVNTVSLDRINSNETYSRNNCQLVCAPVNIMKHNFDNDEIKYFIDKILLNIANAIDYGDEKFEDNYILRFPFKINSIQKTEGDNDNLDNDEQNDIIDIPNYSDFDLDNEEQNDIVDIIDIPSYPDFDLNDILIEELSDATSSSTSSISSVINKPKVKLNIIKKSNNIVPLCNTSTATDDSLSSVSSTSSISPVINKPKVKLNIIKKTDIIGPLCITATATDDSFSPSSEDLISSSSNNSNLLTIKQSNDDKLERIKNEVLNLILLDNLISSEIS